MKTAINDQSGLGILKAISIAAYAALVFSCLTVLGAMQARGEKVTLRNSIEEGNTSWISVSIQDKNGQPVNPDSVTWDVRDQSSGEVLVPETTPTRPSVGAGTPTPTYPSSMVIKLSSCASRIVRERETEYKVLTVKCAHGGNSQDDCSGEATWMVNNLRSIEVSPPTTPGGGCSVGYRDTPTPTKTPTPTRTPTP